MIAVWMLYCIAIATAFVIAGHALEQALRLAGRPTRWAWVIALIGSFVVPFAAWLRPEGFASFPLPTVVSMPPSVAPSTSTAAGAIAASAPAVVAWDSALRWGWGLASGVLLVVAVAALLRLTALRRRWPTRTIDGRLVLVSRDVGPAVVGLWRPRVVLPEWAFELTSEQRELLLAHEEQHMRARDPWLLLGALTAMLVAPWNAALWWQWRRLRLAVETDCDARVLAHGRSPSLYGELLLHVGRRRSAEFVGAPAFGEPASFLEMRIRRLATRLPRWRWAAAALALAIAAGAVVGACETPRPVSPTDARAMPLSDTLPASSAAIRDVFDSLRAEPLRPWVHANLQRLFPALLAEQEGPPMDVFLQHDPQLRVSQAVLVPRTHEVIGVSAINEVFKGFTPGNDAWGLVSRRALNGLVRENVRIIWVHHDPSSRDLSALRQTPEMVMPPWVRRDLGRLYPALLTERTGPPVELWFLLNENRETVRTIQRAGSGSIRVGLAEIHTVFPELVIADLHSWGVMNRRALGGLVRDNVYVVWVRLREGTTPP